MSKSILGDTSDAVLQKNSDLKMSYQEFESIWDAIFDSPDPMAMQLRSDLFSTVRQYLRQKNYTPEQASKEFLISVADAQDLLTKQG